jgi:hypothetical protein
VISVILFCKSKHDDLFINNVPTLTRMSTEAVNAETTTSSLYYLIHVQIISSTGSCFLDVDTNPSIPSIIIE